MMGLNVFKETWNWHTPLISLKYFFKSLKWGWQRATRGYCDLDLWNLDNFYTNLLEASLKDFADMNKMGHPEGMKPEEWDQKIRDISMYFARSKDDAYVNEYEDCLFDLKDTEMRDNYVTREEEIYRERVDNRRLGFKKLLEVYDDLWD